MRQKDYVFGHNDLCKDNILKIVDQKSYWKDISSIKLVDYEHAGIDVRGNDLTCFFTYHRPSDGFGSGLHKDSHVAPVALAYYLQHFYDKYRSPIKKAF